MRYDGIYKGIIVQNNDPEHAGRVKVFVPSVNATLIKNWNDTKNEDKKISHLGENTNTSLTPDIIQQLKEKLPWARVSMPIFGMSTPGTHDNSKNISYIGNDSDLKSQEGNKTARFFEQDQVRSQTRTPSGNTNGSPPRQRLNISGLQLGNFSFPLKSCDQEKFKSVFNNRPPCDSLNSDSGNNPPFFVNPGFNGNSVDTVISTDIPDRLIPGRNVANTNSSITDIFINVVNPNIFINGSPVDLKDTVFDNICFKQSVVPNYSVNYEPPIFFEETTKPVTNSIIRELPVKLVINNILIPGQFFPETTTTSTISYKADNKTVQFSNNNVQGITIRKNSQPVDLNEITSLQPFIKQPSDDVFQTILPRIVSILSMLSPGGGACSAYNRSTTSLLPPEQRRECLIGGNNPISKENRNFGKKDEKSNTSQSGSNQQSKIDTTGPYRPPDHANKFKGIISIPAPGAHVHVRFEEGNPNYPIVVDTFADQADYQKIYDVQGPPNFLFTPADQIQGPPSSFFTPLNQIQGPPGFLSQPQILNPPGQDRPSSPVPMNTLT